MAHRYHNPGKRERAAGKKRMRGSVWDNIRGRWVKLGHKKHGIWLRQWSASVVHNDCLNGRQAENTGAGRALEPARRSRLTDDDTNIN